jgi:hypothetical protein
MTHDIVIHLRLGLRITESIFVHRTPTWTRLRLGVDFGPLMQVASPSDPDAVPLADGAHAATAYARSVTSSKVYGNRAPPTS